MKMMWGVPTRLLRPPEDQQAVQSMLLPSCALEPVLGPFWCPTCVLEQPFQLGS